MPHPKVVLPPSAFTHGVGVETVVAVRLPLLTWTQLVPAHTTRHVPVRWVLLHQVHISDSGPVEQLEAPRALLVPLVVMMLPAHTRAVVIVDDVAAAGGDVIQPTQVIHR